MAQISFLTCMLAVLTFVGCGQGADEKGMMHDDVVAINERVLEKAISQPDSALMMIERLRAGDFSVIDTTGVSLQWSGPVPDHFCDYFRAKVYAQALEGVWLDSAIIIGERLLTTDAAREDLAYRQNVLEMLINACRQHRDYEQAIRWCTELIDLYRDNGDETEALRCEADIGLMLSGIGHADEGLAKSDSVLTLLSGKRKFNEFDASIIALKRKVNVLKNMERSGEFAIRQYGEGDLKSLTHGSQIANSAEQIATAQQMLDLMADYEQHPDEYHDGTYREPPEHLRPGYIDFYRGQAYVFMAEAEAKAGRKAEARKYLSLFNNTDYAKTFTGRKDIAPTYGLLGEYDKMPAIHAEEEALLREQGDTVCAEFATILRDRAMAAEAQGRHAEANDYHRRYETLTTILNDRLLQGKANLYAARFHAAEQQREIERGRVRASRAATVATAIGIVALLALLFAAYAFRQRRRTNEKNRALVKQIEEGFRNKDEIEMLRDTIKELQVSASVGTDGNERKQAGSDVTGSVEGMQETSVQTDSDAELFEHIRQVISKEKLYLNPLFDRQAAIERFGLSKERIGAAFSKGSEFNSIAAFIRDCRLRHAYFMLTEHPEMRIAEIATASGYTHASTFSIDFKRSFGLTPKEYREQFLNNY